MPELPEVEVVRRGLAPHVVGRRIEGVQVHDPRSLTRHTPGAGHFVSALQGASVTAAVRRGKFLWLTFDGPDAGADSLVIHLGMSGQLRVVQASAAPGGQSEAIALSEGPSPDPLKHRRIHLDLDDGTRIDFIDQRIFGGMHLSPLVEVADGKPAGEGSALPLIPASASHIARDVLDLHLDVELAVAALSRRRASIKSLLLNQGIVSGIGNIYADEGLFAARVHPEKPASTISARKCRELITAIRGVMERAVAVGGTSFDTLYVNVDGRSGYFARSLSAYGKEREPCPRCLTPLRRTVVAGRSSFWCPRCQKLR